MRLSLLILGFVFLILVGLRPDSLPFIPDSQFSDAALSHWPAALHLRESVLRGEFPFWQDTILASQPFAANPLNKTAYPPQWLALILPPTLHLNVLIVLHLILAGWGMWRWARALDLPESAALLSALAYAFAPKVLAHLGAGHVDLLYALAWWPPLMLATQRLCSPDSRWQDSLQVGGFAALMFLADVRLSLFALALALAYGLREAIRQRGPTRLRWILPALLMFGLFTLSVTIPLLAWQPYLSRSAMTAADAGMFSLEGGHFVGLVLPPHGGNPETMIYLGLPVLLLAGIALFGAPRQHAFWLVMLLLAALYALGINSPFWRGLVDTLPLLRWFRVPARAWFVGVLIASLMAGYGLQMLMHTVERLRQGAETRRLAVKRLAIAGGLGASLFCGGFTLAMLADLPGSIGIGVMLVGALLGVTLLLAFYGRLSPGNLAALLTFILFADLAWTGRNWVEWRGSDRWLTHQRALVEVLAAENPARIYSPNFALEQQVAVANDLRLFYGVDPFQLSSIVNAIEQGSGVLVTQYSVVLPPLELEPDSDDSRSPDELLREANRDAVPDMEILATWDVSHVVTTYPMSHDRLELRAEVAGYWVYANLDYTEASAMNSPGWPVAWQGLPDEATVAYLNQLTGAAVFIAGAAFAGWLVLLMRGLLRQ